LGIFGKKRDEDEKRVKGKARMDRSIKYHTDSRILTPPVSTDEACHDFTSERSPFYWLRVESKPMSGVEVEEVSNRSLYESFASLHPRKLVVVVTIVKKIRCGKGAGFSKKEAVSPFGRWHSTHFQIHSPTPPTNKPNKLFRTIRPTNLKYFKFKGLLSFIPLLTIKV
jgi:hypothetical protein